MKLEHYDSTLIPNEVFGRMSAPTRESYERFMGVHWKYFKGQGPNRDDQIDRIHHTLLAVDSASGTILGYRYFFFPIESDHCELFNIYVDLNYRRRGIATSLIKRAIGISLEKGINKFIVRVAERSIERDALVRKYSDFSKHYCESTRFTIHYENEVTIYE